jgi:hypothetical protein
MFLISYIYIKKEERKKTSGQNGLSHYTIFEKNGVRAIGVNPSRRLPHKKR